MTLEERAAKIANVANECCGRADGHEEQIEALALKHLQEAVLAAVNGFRDALMTLAQEGVAIALQQVGKED